MSSIDKVKVGDTTYDVSPSASGTLDGYTSNDNGTPPAWDEVSAISSGDTNSSIFGKLTSMVKNVRWLYGKLGTSDFSVSGDTVTGALSSLQGELSDKSPASHTHTVSDLPVTNDTQANATTLIPSSAAVYSLYTTMGDLSSEITELEEKISLIGTIWIYEEDGTFEVPVTGTYQVEMHGGGGGAIAQAVPGAEIALLGGGGSGEVYTVKLSKNKVIDVKIGAGGKSMINYSENTTTAPTGGQTTFGDLSINGGGGAVGKFKDKTDNDNFYHNEGSVGTNSGSLASSGSSTKAYSQSNTTAKGGDGNISNAAQTYGDGGSASYNKGIRVDDGKPGAVIITFIGRSTD